MGELTQANQQRISHRLDAAARRRKNGEIVFLAGIICVLTGLAGYFIGSFYPYKQSVPEFAKKAGEVRARDTAPPPERRK